MQRTTLTLVGLSIIAGALLVTSREGDQPEAVMLSAAVPAAETSRGPAPLDAPPDLVAPETELDRRASLAEGVAEEEPTGAPQLDADSASTEGPEDTTAACEVRFQLTSTVHRSWASSHWHAYQSHDVAFGAKGRKVALVDPGNGYHAAAALLASGESPWLFDRLTGWALPLGDVCGDESKVTLNLTIPESFPVSLYPTAPDGTPALEASTIVYRQVQSGYFEVVTRERRDDGITCELVPGDYVVGVNALGFEPLFEPITVTDQGIEQVIELTKEDYFTVQLSALERGQPTSFSGAQLHSITATDEGGRDVLLRLSGEASSVRGEDGKVESVDFAGVELALEPSSEITVTVAGKDIAIHPGLAGQTIEVELL